ncbi:MULTISPECIES: S-methyl-5-thioribose-1-phosphate isomerase [unclassified Oceanispirochaeta]|uniref:S-methyl-5-thioribose-1-phosphate isomerase n=1 Tax=unclassified Oceanispirochaeta TaxID=2635722 RepID=UPI000E08CFD2|nr:MULTISPECIES: S-methyl-5-thioribose-1-phosphate isomerase [unclassified Oceanispirochaeta]MBF9017959.1 S-methyl-5-thioribose-1-phosphate isomerase [Oceanispirochaeta sp. M2]NPD74470.1 S-methyl-5-thioribose-1-phosphate isomerase [Oceanispirochaeta sp. M1]RDG29678.1 S-methyl-5-thioribose-1-phosphate isomerase [Oceanispirochaeta sp. M1]
MKTIVPALLNSAKDKLVLLDQTLLPVEEKFLELDKKEDIWEAIKKLRVRGAPAIGVAAAFGMYVCANRLEEEDVPSFKKKVIELREYFATSRPTAVNLFWALDRMFDRFEKEEKAGKSVDQIKAAFLEESEEILREDQEMGIAIGKYGLELLKPGMGLLTHCNAGGLACSGYGTALAPMYAGHDKDYDFKIYADETRPLLQGSRLTAYELNKAGLDVTVICDNMASLVMREGKIDAVLVGTDRITANGDVINKIGTSGVAILAKEYGIPFYVLGPYSTVDLNTPTGNEVEIELRESDEIGNGFGRRTAPEEVKAYNPAFDITENKYVTAIITEKGIVRAPYKENLAKLFKD